MHKKSPAGSKRITEGVEEQQSVLLREVSCNFVDRVLRIRSHTIHEITLSYLKGHEMEVFSANHLGPF